ncbi:MAG: HAD family hydrolase [Firmicutes bacterium]|nr:HAD family hydrolase [Bacillota bacterium]
MTRKLFLTDLDGTLLDDDKQISPPTRQVLEKWTKAGHIFAFGTGRALTSALAIRQALGLEKLCRYLVCYNGVQIYDAMEKKMIFETGIRQETVLKIMDLAESLNVHCHTYQGPYIVARRETQALKDYGVHIHMPVIFSETVIEQLVMPPCLLLAIERQEPEKLKTLQQALKEQFSDEVTSYFSSSEYLDILPAGVNKGKALSTLASHLEIPIEDTIAAGDEENDISMVEAAGFGIAMKNGTERIRALADMITEEDNCHDGLATALRQLLASYEQ